MTAPTARRPRPRSRFPIEVMSAQQQKALMPNARWVVSGWKTRCPDCDSELGHFTQALLRELIDQHRYRDCPALTA
ncbi:hypothetical protein [Blastococcus mobilis]|uniref:Uncharacterized protein n=1 Tax=Blastococcus mobilis TaxID=1938746 RepID=A0A238VWS0_9ACTN|nr:hypothetical protein [Blastococcus mobilis]SNR38631.1 hypothetical protein SAMN06272737_105106 [Blastococcus mobilis]